MRLRRLQLKIETSDGPYGSTLDFPDGLVVVWADNSMGKSTCVKSILVALGMEAMLTTSQSELPLPPAMMARLESPSGEYDVIESEVYLEIENSNGQPIVIQRTIKGNRDKNLISVHQGPALTSPGSATSTRDYFVSRPGAASREAGFHHFLAEYLGWKLPMVQTYDGNEYPLYLQCIFPYFVVEQTRGWSTIQPPLPTHFRVRDAHKRAVEFILALDAHGVALKRQELLFEKSRIESEWSAQVKRSADLAEHSAATIQALPSQPQASWPPTVAPILLVPHGEQWVLIEHRIAIHQAELQRLVQEAIPRVQEIASVAEGQLAEAEHNIRDKQTTLSRLLDALEMEGLEIGRVDERLRVIDEDIQRNKDADTLKHLGSRQTSTIENGVCPVCHQQIHDSLVPLAPNQAIMSLEENIQFLGEQKQTYEVMRSNGHRVVDARTRQVTALRSELSAIRDRARALRETLISDGRLPSIAAIQERLKLEQSIREDVETAELFGRIVNGFESLSSRWGAIQQELRALPREDTTTSDKAKINAWAHVFREQLKQYGFRSFPVDQVVMSSDTYKPEHQGFDLESDLLSSSTAATATTSFSLQTSISASDLIRTIWSYLHGLLELGRTGLTHHPGCIIFDEPRQQSARDESFAELLKRASTAGAARQQVVLFTSERRERLQAHLNGLPHTFKAFDGRVIKKL